MKLSEKGIETIFSALLKTIEERDLVFREISQGVFKKHIEALEFEPDDFVGGCCQNGKGHVTLTVEEARYALKCIRYLASGCDVAIDKKSLEEMWKYADKLVERISQAEAGHGN